LASFDLIFDELDGVSSDLFDLIIAHILVGQLFELLVVAHLDPSKDRLQDVVGNGCLLGGREQSIAAIGKTSEPS